MKYISIFLICIGFALIIYALTIKDKMGALYFIGGCTLTLSTLSVVLIRSLGSKKEETKHTDYLAVIGAILGAVLGGVAGYYSRLGGLVISTTGLDLPVRDFGKSLGALTGSFLGAFIGIMFLVIVRYKWSRKRKQSN